MKIINIIMHRKPSLECEALGGEVHVMYAVDVAVHAVLASIYSAIHNSKHAGRLRFQIFTPADYDEGMLCKRIYKGFMR